jgi:hypothetical protein
MKSKLLLAALVSGVLFSAVSYSQADLPGNINANDTTYTTDTTPAERLMAVPVIPVDGDNDLLVYPNPVTSTTRVVLDEVPFSIVNVDVIDMNGRIDRSFQYAPGTYFLDVDLTNLPLGLYSVRVSGRDIGYHNLKVIKE